MTTATLTLDRVNALTQTEFTEHFGGIYEHSPWIAQQAWLRRPYADANALAHAFEQVVDAACEGQLMDLILAHPELAGQAAARGDLTVDSRNEQRGAGLDQCSPGELALIQQLNAQYRHRFGFAFIVAVKGLTRADILAALQSRLQRDPPEEVAQALDEIKRIARFRLQLKLHQPSPN